MAHVCVIGRQIGAGERVWSDAFRPDVFEQAARDRGVGENFSRSGIEKHDTKWIGDGSQHRRPRGVEGQEGRVCGNQRRCAAVLGFVRQKIGFSS